MQQYKEKMERFSTGKGFVAALDQSGGSTPKALKLYGVSEDEYKNESEMFDKVHEMRARIISDKAFTGERILGAILFEGTVDRMVEGQPTASYLWNSKRIVPFVKIDKGLAEAENGVRLMKPITMLSTILAKAKAAGAFGTKMRSVIDEANEDGIKAIVDQQFEIGRKIWESELVPIIEPEVSIDSKSKAEAESLLKQELERRLDELEEEARVIFKLTLPEEPNLYASMLDDPRLVRIVALSGGYTRDEANERLKQNKGVIASFSRALSEGLSVDQSDEEFSATLDKSIEGIYQASLT